MGDRHQPTVFDLDPSLEEHRGHFDHRSHFYHKWINDIAAAGDTLESFSEGWTQFGFRRDGDALVFTEWLPSARAAALVGEFNGWDPDATPLEPGEFGRWSVRLRDTEGGPRIAHGSKLKLRIQCPDGSWVDRIPAWIRYSIQNPETNLFDGVHWMPEEKDTYVLQHPRPRRPESLRIYEAHVGMAGIEERVATYNEFTDVVLPRIKRLGYNAVQLMAVAEHAHYGCFGYHVTSFFAPASRCGSPEDLKRLVDTAHRMGIIVLMDLVHAHMSSNTLDGIAQQDGTDHCYTHGGPKGHHDAWDSKLFNYGKWEVMRFLLSNLRWWIDEYGFDGFRFDGVTSMLYHHHGLGTGFSGGYHEYFGPATDVESCVYMMLANDLVHRLCPSSAVTVAEDVSGMPTLCRPVAEGGFGFDYRLSMALPDLWIKMLKEQSDDEWNMGNLTHTLQNRRWREKCIAYSESHDQSIVGDKTIAMWLMDKEMYFHMSRVVNPDSLIVDRGMALHKMIRLMTCGLGGEGYLTFLGNEFGHPEWVDFPREGNGWSYKHCRRRWDLADDETLKYNWLQLFDEALMHAEERFGWLASEEQYCTLAHEGDKVVVFERGDCVFVLNLHPTQSFTDYKIGVKFATPAVIVLDTDEPRFGGQGRLLHGHHHPFPLSEPWQGREHSIQVYIPARTAMLLVPEDLVQGGIRIHLDPTAPERCGWPPLDSLVVEVNDRVQPVSPEGFIALHERSAEFRLRSHDGGWVFHPGGAPGQKFRVHFPGDYAADTEGFLSLAPLELQAGSATAPTMIREVTSSIALTELTDIRTGGGRGAVAGGDPVPIVLVSCEIHPYTRVSGASVVAGSYAAEFSRRGHPFLSVTPKYGDVEGATHVGSKDLWVAGQQHVIQFYHLRRDLDGRPVDYIFLEEPTFQQQQGGAHNNARACISQHPDNLIRFVLLALGALEAPLVVQQLNHFTKKTLFIANDWQTGMVPVYLADKFQASGNYRDARSIFVLHNLGCQGRYPEYRFPIPETVGLPEGSCECLRLHGCIDLAKGAITRADRVITVSPSYAGEIQTPDGGCGLENLLRQKGQEGKLVGILNGVDTSFDPATDTTLAQRYDANNLQARAINKAQLQRSLGLEVQEGTLLIGFVGRLSAQKGVELLQDAVPWLMNEKERGAKVQVILMGDGERQYREFLSWVEVTYRGRVCGYTGFNGTVERHMLGGCDAFLLPSRYEPCGLPQLFAHRYGCLPVVHATGGLRDTVKDGETGFTFEPWDWRRLREALERVLTVFYKDRPRWEEMQRRVMGLDWSWGRAIDEYEEQIGRTFQ
eukprot:CAMPEP_0204361538 /NCGR_PEP_ID=MMETSP0469-20131031/38889_1 /ASSEMBLY_ACC=CAM_ASM_000384 /TAXON_ID=2969 /ORGANISM="Oxyrrhis marina" /LENGTH=1306 /DNA_ID=CAMNT_0051349943 /DNA_START=36 /DNA_END=3956 /DNA_ORIENTATION=+